jgi:hypothetical protein
MLATEIETVSCSGRTWVKISSPVRNQHVEPQESHTRIFRFLTPTTSLEKKVESHLFRSNVTMKLQAVRKEKERENPSSMICMSPMYCDLEHVAVFPFAAHCFAHRQMVNSPRNAH